MLYVYILYVFGIFKNTFIRYYDTACVFSRIFLQIHTRVFFYIFLHVFIFFVCITYYILSNNTEYIQKIYIFIYTDYEKIQN